MYRVELDLFTGPLDLLLYLVRKHEVDVRELPIAQITRQFQDFLEILEVLDLELVGDFVVMAATLVEIKSRLVLPQAEDEEQPAEEAATDDPRSELIEKLLEYKRIKEAATALEERAAEWQERYPRLSNDRPSAAKDPAADRIKEVELWDLVSALGRVLQTKVSEEQTSVRYDDTPLHVYVEQIRDRVRQAGELKFTSLFDGETLRSKIVGMFLAILELVRHHGFRAEQSVLGGEITIRPPLSDSQE
jgi:segregation and condensation protein A